MWWKKLFGTGAMLALVGSVSACDAALDPVTKESQSPVEMLEAKDKEAVEVVFSTSFASVWNGVESAVQSALDATAAAAPAFSKSANTISGSIDNKVKYSGGGTIAIKGTYAGKLNSNGTTTVDIKLTGAWDQLPITLKNGSTTVSTGSSTLTGSLTVSSKLPTGTITWKGNLVAEGIAIPFELEITLKSQSIVMAGDIGGKTYAVDVNKYANPLNTENTLNNDAGITSITLTGGTLTPALSATIDTYSVTLNAGATTFGVTVVSKDENATVAISKSSGACSVSGGSVSGLSDGATCALSIVVTAEDGTTKRTVTLTIHVRVPGTIEYAGATSEVVMGKAFTTGIPTYSNLVAPTFTIDPYLPVGLSFDDQTGEIHGMVDIFMDYLVAPTTFTIEGSDTAGNIGTAQIELSVIYAQYFDAQTWPTEMNVGSNSNRLALVHASEAFMSNPCAFGTYYYGCPSASAGYGLAMYSSLAYPIQFYFTQLAAGSYQVFYKISSVATTSGSITNVKTEVIGSGTVQETENVNSAASMSDYSFGFTITGQTNKLMFSNTGSGINNHGIDNIIIKRVP